VVFTEAKLQDKNKREKKGFAPLADPLSDRKGNKEKRTDDPDRGLALLTFVERMRKRKGDKRSSIQKSEKGNLAGKKEA